MERRVGRLWRGVDGDPTRKGGPRPGCAALVALVVGIRAVSDSDALGQSLRWRCNGNCLRGAAWLARDELCAAVYVRTTANDLRRIGILPPRFTWWQWALSDHPC